MNNFEELKKLISNTPLIEIRYKYNNTERKAIIKCEWYSLTGSIKDKVAYQIFKDAYESGHLHKGDKVVEVSSGNMGISVAAMGNLLGNPVTILMPKNMSEERKKLIRLYGANLIETDNFVSAFDTCKRFVESGYFCTEQFKNSSNTQAHKDITAREIIDKSHLFHADCFVAGIGTSGTLSGVGRELKSRLGLNVIAIEPTNSRIISSPPPYGHHELQGLSDEILPDLFDRTLVDDVIQISDDDAIAMARKLCGELSLGVGISSGANFLGAVLSEKNAISIFPEDNKKYLSTRLSNTITTPLVDSIELIDYHVI